MGRFAVAVAFACLLLIAAPLRAQQAPDPAVAPASLLTDAIPAEPQSVSPPARPVTAEVGLHLIKLDRVSEAESPEPQFVAQFVLVTAWDDARLALVADGPAEDRVYEEENAVGELVRIWHPDLSFPDQEGKPQLEDILLRIDHLGRVTLEQRMTVTFSTRFDLARFPFDRQRFTMKLQSFEWDRNALRLTPISGRIAMELDAGLPEWSIAEFYEELGRAREAGTDRQVSQMSFVIEAQRDGAYYLYKILLPMVVVIVLSWSNFWITGRGDGRIRLTFLCLLAVIAYDSVLAKYLPRLNFVTFMDAIVLVGIAAIAANVVENAWVHHLIQSGREDRAREIDYWAKRTIPASVLLAIGGAAFYYLG